MKAPCGTRELARGRRRLEEADLDPSHVGRDGSALKRAVQLAPQTWFARTWPTNSNVLQLQELMVVAALPVMPRKFAAIDRLDGDPTVPLTS